MTEQIARVQDVRPTHTPGPWRLHIKARREVTCECGYRTFQHVYAPDAAVASAACTKCGRVWESTLSDEERATIPPHPEDAAPALLDALEAMCRDVAPIADISTPQSRRAESVAVALLRKHGRLCG